MTNNINLPLCGIIPPIVTPLLDCDTLDHTGLERLIEHILEGGVQGIFVLGTTGEAQSLSYRLRYELIENVCKLVAGRVPVLVGITDTAFIESLHLADKAAKHGATTVVLAPPYYFPAGQPELLEYLKHIIPQLPLPVFLYNMPSHTKLVFEPETVRSALTLPGVIGLKDSSANMTYFQLIRNMTLDLPHFSLLMGPDNLLAEAVMFGAHGGVCGGANLFPKIYVELFKAAQDRQIDRMMELHQLVMGIVLNIFEIGKYSSGFIKGIKCALSIMGICSDFMAEPFHRFRKDERERIHTYLEKCNLSDEINTILKK
ncbi:dihydrodipicolinate synthase family protein [candidate division KSB1 bacterium]|nr:dihydrodipicolinate synthase family protein [candidate division KSB1 bacterium]